MDEVIRGDVLTKDEMKMRGIVATMTERGGMELRTKESMTTIANWLVDSGFIEKHQQDSALIFLDLRRAYEASMGIKWLALREQLLEQLNLSAGQATELYDAIRHELGIRQAGRIHDIVSGAITSQYQAMRAEDADIYRLAFDTLTRAMKNVRDTNKTVACPV